MAARGSNVNCINKSISGTSTDFYYEDTFVRDMVSAEQDQSLVAIKAYEVDDLFWYKDDLYRVTVAIASGGNIVLGTGSGVNAVKTTVSDELQRKAGLSDLAPAFDPTINYTKNACVIYNRDVYRFNADHSGAWTGTDATKITVTEAGGHTMIPATQNDADVDTVAGLTWADASDEKVINAYTAKKYSNTDTKFLYVQVPKGKNTVGVWNDDWKSTTVRTGWMWHECLHGILSDDDIEIIPVFDMGHDETVNLYAFRVDDNVTKTVGTSTTTGGAIAFKFNGSIRTNNLKVGVKLVHHRTETIECSTIS